MRYHSKQKETARRRTEHPHYKSPNVLSFISTPHPESPLRLLHTKLKTLRGETCREQHTLWGKRQRDDVLKLAKKAQECADYYNGYSESLRLRLSILHAQLSADFWTDISADAWSGHTEHYLNLCQKAVRECRLEYINVYYDSVKGQERVA